jgi:hypothetical protein
VFRRKPLPPDVRERLETLGPALAQCSAVVFAYLFGSAGRGELRPTSDVDVAIFLEPGADHAEGLLDAIGCVTRHVGSDEVDVVLLNTAPTALVGRCLQSRRVIVDRDPFLRHRFESAELRKFFDFRVLEARALGPGARGG